MAENFDAAFSRIKQTEDEFYGGGFAGAVRSQESEDLAAANFEINAVHGAGFRTGPKIFEDFGEAADGDDRVAT